MDEQLKNEVVELIKAAMLDVFKYKTTTEATDNTELIDSHDLSDLNSIPNQIPPKPLVRQTTKEDDIVSLNRSVGPTQKRKAAKSTPSKTPISSSASPKKSGKGTQARIVPFDPNEKRPDLFVELGLDQGCKEDVEIDRKLNAGRQPAQRGTRTTMVTVRCSRCDREYTVSNKLVTRDDEGLKYTCDRCIGRS